MGAPRLPTKDCTITFWDRDPTRSPGEYAIHAHVEVLLVDMSTWLYRTSNRFLMKEIDRLHRKLGTLYAVKVKVRNTLTPLEVIENPNIPMFPKQVVESNILQIGGRQSDGS